MSDYEIEVYDKEHEERRMGMAQSQFERLVLEARYDFLRAVLPNRPVVSDK